MIKWSKRRSSRRRIKLIEKKETPESRKKIIEIAIYLVEIFVVVFLAYAIINFGFVKTDMAGESMQQTIDNGDELLVNKIIYKVLKPKRFDIIAYSQNSAEHKYLTIKRIIGMPGERILIDDGKIFINGEELIENINVEPMNTGGLAEEEITLESNEYFVLGDNRNNSQDSRFNNVGTIVSDDIIGKVWFRLKPFSNVKSLNIKKNNNET